MFKRSKWKLIFLLCLCSYFFPTLTYSNNNLAQNVPWFLENWNGNDKPFELIRAKIDSLAEQDKLTTSIIKNDRVKKDQHPKDPIRTFTYAYDLFKAQKEHPSVYTENLKSDSIFTSASSPHTYNYTRIRFLIDASDIYRNPTNESDRDLSEVGRRLLSKDANDYYVEYYLIKVLHPWESIAKKQEALSYANDLIRKFPHKANVYAAQGSIYFSCWMVHRDRQDAMATLNISKKYLQIASPDAPFRVNVNKADKLLVDWLKDNPS